MTLWQLCLIIRPLNSGGIWSLTTVNSSLVSSCKKTNINMRLKLLKLHSSRTCYSISACLDCVDSFTSLNPDLLIGLDSLSSCSKGVAAVCGNVMIKSVSDCGSFCCTLALLRCHWLDADLTAAATTTILHFVLHWQRVCVGLFVVLFLLSFFLLWLARECI